MSTPLPPSPLPDFARRVLRSPLARIGAFVVLFWALSRALELVQRLPLLSPLGDLDEERKAVAALLAFRLMTRCADRRTLTEAGFARTGWLAETLAGFAGGGLLLSVLIGIMALCGVYRVVGHGDSVFPLLPLWSYAVVAVFEETVFRGYLLQMLERAWGTTVAVVVSCAAFGLVHLANPIEGVTPWQRLAGPGGVCLESVVLAGAYLLTRRLWLPIGIHWAWDYFESNVFGVPDSGLWETHTVLRAGLVGPFWATGGPFGPEGSVFFAVGITLVGLWLLRMARRRAAAVPPPLTPPL